MQSSKKTITKQKNGIGQYILQKGKKHPYALPIMFLGLAIYIRGLISGYVTLHRAGRMLATGILYILMHYITLSRADLVKKYKYLIIAGVLFIAILVLITSKNARMSISVLLWQVAILSVMYSLEDSIHNRRKFSSLQFFQAGGTLFSICFTLSFIAAFLGRNTEFTLTCTEISQASTSIITYVENKLGMSTTSHATPQPTPPSGGMSMEQGVTQNDLPVRTSFLDTLKDYKQQLIDETITSQKTVNLKACQVFIDQIKSYYNKPSFRIPVIVLMFLVISPLLRITLYIITGVNLLIFRVLKKCGVYKTHKQLVEIETIVE